MDVLIQAAITKILNISCIFWPLLALFPGNIGFDFTVNKSLSCETDTVYIDTHDCSLVSWMDKLLARSKDS